MKYNCNVIKDLMPLCEDKVATKDSEQVVMKHLSECNECLQYYDEMKKDLIMDDDNSVPETNYIELAKKMKKKTKIKRICVILSLFIFFELCISYAAGYRLNPQSAAEIGRAHV